VFPRTSGIQEFKNPSNRNSVTRYLKNPVHHQTNFQLIRQPVAGSQTVVREKTPERRSECSVQIEDDEQHGQLRETVKEK
jgi:hypothetical protein